MDLPTRIRRGAQGVSSRIGTRNIAGRTDSEQQAKKPTQRLTERFRAYKRSLSDLILGPPKSADSFVTCDGPGQQNTERAAFPVALGATCSYEHSDALKKPPPEPASLLDNAGYSMESVRGQVNAQHASTLRDLTGVGSHLPTDDRGIDQDRKRRDSYRDSIVGHGSSDEYNVNLRFSSPRSTFGYPTRTSSCTTNSSRSELPDGVQRHKRYSSLWAYESFAEGSTTESIFSGRAQSTISISSVGTVEAPITDEARPAASKRQRLSSSSTGTLSSYYNDVNLEENPLPTPPSSAGLRNFRKSIDRSSAESLNITNQLQNFEKPTKKTNGDRPERPVLKIEPVSGWLNIGEMDEETSAKPLSVISEGNSDAAHSFMDTSPIQPSGPFDKLPIPPNPTRSSRRSFSDSTSEIPHSLTSPKPMVSTRATSINEQSELDDASEDDSLLSDDIDETDDPFLEAFAASSLDPNLLPFVLNLKDHLVNQVASRVADWVRSHAIGSGESGSGGSSSANFSPNNSSGSGPRKSGRKRSFFGEGGDNSEREDGDDEQGKRRRTEPDLLDRIGHGLFACPFTKRYPEKKWPKCHKKAFKEVHRIKEHIYRTHMLAPHCERCFAEFETEAERAAHSRQQVPCDVVEPPATMIGVTADIKDRLKSRKGKQNWDEDSKWRAMYTILFEDQTEIPSPYCEFDMSIGPMSQDQCTQFIQQQSSHCEREIRGLLEERLQDEPGYDILRARVLETIREAFDTYFPATTAATPSSASKIEGHQALRKSKSPASTLSTIELNSFDKKNLSSHQSTPIDGDHGASSLGDALQPRNDLSNRFATELTVHSTPEPGSERDLLVPLKVDGNNETPEPSCTGGHEGGMLAGLYDTQFNFSDEIGDSFYFYGDRPLEFLGEHPWLTEHTEPAVENP
ncbi:unnamed protein product [Clonostachys rosea f. rosea IK726]|uniref:C2H2-type domain-containing protein n=2 Tax=Bionectria ochroleuca TaxID=29856 RepID=A0A0B7JIG1_BIOOC|nr:unnamed protein product [Clonostachys rosea f. rosea IK726]